MEAEVGSAVGQVIEGRYRIERKIGGGGMGVVYVARQLNVDRRIALKLLRPERARVERAVAQFLTEATAVSRLASPHTVTLHDVGRLADGAPFIAMELLEGQTLRQRIVQGPLELDEIMSVIDSVALSLAEAHERGVIHRDLKPNNVFLARTPGHSAYVKVLDFGLARLLDAEDDQVRAAGTPPYMAPETLRGGTVDARTDVYALAMVAYELLAGRHPFADEEGDALIEAQLSKTPPPVSDVCERELPAAVSDLLARALAKPPRLRPADAGAFRDAWRDAFGLAATRPPSEPRAVPLSQQETVASQTVVSRTLPDVRSRGSRSRNQVVGSLLVAGLLAVSAWLAWGSPAASERAVDGEVPPPPAPTLPQAAQTGDQTPSPSVSTSPTVSSSAATEPSSAASAPEPPIPSSRRPRAARPEAQPATSSSSAPPPAHSSTVPHVDERIHDYLDG